VPAKKLARFDRPIKAWYVTATTDKSGAETLDDQREILDGHSPSAGLDSPLLGGTTSAIVNALIVADTNKVTGYTIGSISGYVAVLALSQARSLDACSELPSIFDLMADCGGDKPAVLSANRTQNPNDQGARGALDFARSLRCAARFLIAATLDQRLACGRKSMRCPSFETVRSRIVIRWKPPLLATSTAEICDSGIFSSIRPRRTLK
jgi:hypothetical protein